MHPHVHHVWTPSGGAVSIPPGMGRRRPGGMGILPPALSSCGHAIVRAAAAVREGFVWFTFAFSSLPSGCQNFQIFLKLNNCLQTVPKHQQLSSSQSPVKTSFWNSRIEGGTMGTTLSSAWSLPSLSQAVRLQGPLWRGVGCIPFPNICPHLLVIGSVLARSTDEDVETPSQVLDFVVA